MHGEAPGSVILPSGLYLPVSVLAHVSKGVYGKIFR